MRTYVSVTVLCACAEVCMLISHNIMYHICSCCIYALYKNRLIVKAKAWDFIREHRVVCSIV